MFNDVLSIKKMLDELLIESNNMSHKVLIREIDLISQAIQKKVDWEVSKYEEYMEEYALASEKYEDSITVNNG